MMLGDANGPPQPERDRPWLWLSALKVPNGTAEMAAAVVNPTDTGMSYGVQGGFDRWTGEVWESAGSWLFSLDQWGGFADTVSPGEMATIPAIGLSAPPQSMGPVGYFRLHALTSGWYRVGFPRKEQLGTFGVIRVTDTAPVTVPIDNPRPPTLLSVPTVMRRSGPLRLYGLPTNHDGLTTFDDVHRFNEAMASSVGLQRWRSGSWETVTSLPVGLAAEPASNPEEVQVILPSLPDGTYRVIRDSPSGELGRVIWIDHSLTS